MTEIGGEGADPASRTEQAFAPGGPAGETSRAPDPKAAADIARAVAKLPQSGCILTAAFEDDRTGVRVMCASPCATEPKLISVAARKGHAIEPLIRDSHAFAVCIPRPDDKLLRRKFPEGGEASPDSDPFDALPLEELLTGSPVIKRCVAVLDCEVVRHFDLEADHELYVGLVVSARIYEREDEEDDARANGDFSADAAAPASPGRTAQPPEDPPSVASGGPNISL